MGQGGRLASLLRPREGRYLKLMRRKKGKGGKRKMGGAATAVGENFVFSFSGGKREKEYERKKGYLSLTLSQAACGKPTCFSWMLSGSIP